MSLNINQPLALQADIDKLKNELRQERGINSLIGAILLTNRRLFAILVCESPVQAKAAIEVMETEVAQRGGEPVPFLYYGFKRQDNEPAVSKELVLQILEPLYNWDNSDKDKKKKVFVVDASDARKDDEEGWIVFFQRMNEVRNTLMDYLSGPLLLILTPSLAKEFPLRAPDFWSIRNEFVQAEADIKELEPLIRYKKKMKQHYGTLQIWKMTSAVELEGIYTRVNLLSTPIAFRRSVIEELEKEFREKKESEKQAIDGLKSVQNHDRLFILGKPGAGKTTFLKFITLQAIAGNLDYVPVFIPLRSYSDSGKPLLDFIAEQFARFDFPDAAPFIKAILNEGKAVVLCDGLDEVNKEDGLRDRVIDELKKLGKDYPNIKLIITCRVATEYRFEDFVYVEMADFDEKQITAYVYKWFFGESYTAEQFLKEFKSSQNKRLQELARNPLLLTLLCIGFEEIRKFPERRSEIYDEATDALLRKWDTSRGIVRDTAYRNLSLGRKRQMFARIAWEFFKNGKYLIPVNELSEKVTAYVSRLPDTKEAVNGIQIIKEIESQHGIFTERAEGIYSFAHLTFQEYYTAKYIVSNIHKENILNFDRLSNENWREVILLTAEMLDDGDKFFEIFTDELHRFAAEHKRLTALLNKAEEYANQITKAWKQVEKRIVSVSLILLVARALTLTLTIDITRVLDRALDLARALDPTIDRVLIFDLAIAIARALNFDLALARAINLVRNIPRVRMSNSDHVRYIRKCYENALELSQQHNLKNIHTALSRLTPPSEKPSSKEWDNYADGILQIMKTYRPIQDYELTQEETKQVERYLYAAKLCVDCLNVAYVSDREAIEDRLLKVSELFV